MVWVMVLPQAAPVPRTALAYVHWLPSFNGNSVAIAPGEQVRRRVCVPVPAVVEHSAVACGAVVGSVGIAAVAGYQHRH